jgi:hypothetical protein
VLGLGSTSSGTEEECEARLISRTQKGPCKLQSLYTLAHVLLHSIMIEEQKAFSSTNYDHDLDRVSGVQWGMLERDQMHSLVCL